MLILFFLLIPIIYTIIKLIIFIIIWKFGKFSYDGLTVAGFKYHAEKDIFYSTKNAWQKNFGYSHLYDVGAPIFRMIIDTEPIKFFYNDKNWLLTFWKGQYGIVTGAEIGIYQTSDKEVTKNTLYMPVSDEEMLDMEFILYKKDKVIMHVKAHHWWLAAFKLAMFSKPKDLMMDIKITFPNQDMLHAFLNVFKRKGYKDKNYSIINNTFIFTFKKPKTRKVWTRNWFFDGITQHFNHRNVKLYNKYLSDAIDTNKVNDESKTNLIMVKDIVPDILKGDAITPNKKHIAKRLVNENDYNVLLLKENIYSNLRGR